MKSSAAQWIAVYFFPYIIIVIFTIVSGVGYGGAALVDFGSFIKSIFLPIIAVPPMAVFGYKVGFSANSESAAFYTLEFKLALAACLAFAALLFVCGIRKRKAFWGKIVNAFGFYVFCIGGLVSLAPST